MASSTVSILIYFILTLNPGSRTWLTSWQKALCRFGLVIMLLAFKFAPKFAPSDIT